MITLIAAALPLIAQTPEVAPPTWSGEIAELIYSNCTECHRPGEAAPFALQSYEDARKRASMIALVTEEGQMPPWHPVQGFGEFIGARTLSAEQTALLAAWADAGAPEGDASRAPAPPKFVEGWQHGEPDLVLTMAKAFPVPAAGPDIYRNFCLPVGLDEDRWIRAIEVRPSARKVVHHVLFARNEDGSARAAEAADPVSGFHGMDFDRQGSLGGWAVGAGPYVLPDGLAQPFPKGSDLVLQAHFHPSGKAEEEVTTVGIYFAEEAPARELVELQLPPMFGAFSGIDIPAGEEAWTLEDSMELPVATTLYSLGGHAHQLARELHAHAIRPDGERVELLRIDAWNFNWQGRYQYTQPVALPAGSTLHARLVYDNSENNPANPFQPPRRVRWGRESFDEMAAITFISVATAAEDTKALKRAARDKQRQARREGSPPAIDLYEQALGLDRDGNGKLTAEELPSQLAQRMMRLDTNGDGELDASELKALKGITAGGRRKR